MIRYLVLVKSMMLDYWYIIVECPVVTQIK